jgi:DNA-directed RNA polymerase specialized sigma24 family protein
MIANEALNIRDLSSGVLAKRSLAASGETAAAWDALVRAYLPLVYGSAVRFLPGNAEASSEVAAAVFQLFALRMRRLRKKTLIASWLLRSTWFAAWRKRKRLRLPAAPSDPAAKNYDLLLRRLFALKPVEHQAVLLHFLLNESPERAAQVLRISPCRFQAQAVNGATRLSKQLKRVTTNSAVLLRELVSEPQEEVTASILNSLREAPPTKAELVRSTLSAWRWMRVRLFFKRLLATLSVIVCLVALLVGSFVWLVKNGFVSQIFFRFGANQLAKEIPGLAQPARPWPVSPQDRVLVGKTVPKNSAELYALTNIWTARLTFTPDEWRKITPSRVPPVPDMFQGGKMNLRNPKARRSGLAGVVGLDFNWVQGRLDFADGVFYPVGVRYRGNGTYVNSLFGPKQSFKVDLNQFIKKQKLAGLEKLNFVNSVPDNSYIHDALGEKLFSDLGIPAPRTAYAYLTLNVPGKFNDQALGLYLLIEDIDKEFAAARFGSKNIPIFKPVTTDLFSDLGNDWNAYAEVYDLKTKATPDQKHRILELAQLTSRADDAEFARRLPEYLDLEEFAVFVAGHVLLSSYDGFLANGQNFYVYLNPESNKLGFIPWDQDHAWGEFGYVGTADQREHASIWHPQTYHFIFLERVMKVEAFRQVYRKTIENALANYFTKERLFPEIDRLAALIRPAVAAESDFRLKRFDQAISDQWLPGPRENGNAEGPKAPPHQIKRFVTNRIVSVREQLDGKSEGARLNRKW